MRSILKGWSKQTLERVSGQFWFDMVHSDEPWNSVKRMRDELKNFTVDELEELSIFLDSRNVTVSDFAPIALLLSVFMTIETILFNFPKTFLRYDANPWFNLAWTALFTIIILGFSAKAIVNYVYDKRALALIRGVLVQELKKKQIANDALSNTP